MCFLTLFIIYPQRRSKIKEMALKAASWSGIIYAVMKSNIASKGSAASKCHVNWRGQDNRDIWGQG